MIPYTDKLIILNGEDKTSRVEYIRHEGRYCKVKFKNSKDEYTYKTLFVDVYENPKNITVDDKFLYVNGEQRTGVAAIQVFKQFTRIIYKNGYAEVVKSSTVKVEESALDDPKSKNCFDYFKEVSKVIGLQSEDGYNILSGKYEKITSISKETVLNDYLSGNIEYKLSENNSAIIFPFGYNLSQKQGVYNALNNKLSIIEGPPGTGKTQTILNIIANAIMRDQSVAVVSNNNSATENVLEKLKKYGIDFICAFLGNNENKVNFIENQQQYIGNINGWLLNPNESRNTYLKLKTESEVLDQILKYKNSISKIEQELSSIKVEFIHFKDFANINPDAKNPKFPNKLSAKEILLFKEEYEYLKKDKSKIGFIAKIKMAIEYGIYSFKFLNTNVNEVLDYCLNEFYLRRIKELENKQKHIKDYLLRNDFETKMSNYTDLSIKILKDKLARKYSKSLHNSIYTVEDLWKHSKEFVEDYPCVLSTTYSLRTSLSVNTLYDYVIVDEASQVDLTTGALAMSCAKNAVVVGDLKQLPNVVKTCDKTVTDEIFKKYNLLEPYRYSTHSFLSSITALFFDAPHVLLKEHYRCHPEIIGFCNKRFYDGELVVLTKVRSKAKPMAVYKTVPGNHARDHYNQRQIDVIKNEVLPSLNTDISNSDIGIVTPYRAQANALKKEFANTDIKCDTADKFQGQERKVMIFSTVDNEIGDFASDPNRLNVAVSRAEEQFIVVTDGNENDNKSPIHELIGYINYRNCDIINSNIYSVFDTLYKNSEIARQKILQKHGKVSEFDSENLMYGVICEALKETDRTQLSVSVHVPMRMIIRDKTKLNERELSFDTNHLSHVDFLIYSRLSYEPVLIIEVDGYAFHQKNEKQLERDSVKDSIFAKYNIPIMRFSTVESNEKERLKAKLKTL